MIYHCSTSYFIFLILKIFSVQGFIGEPCKYDEDCFVEHSYCEMQQICQCKQNFLDTEDRETCIAMVGGHCHSKYDCSSLPNSICKDYKCECDSGFIPDPQGSRCLPVATNYYGECSLRRQCTDKFGPNSNCTKGKCHCIGQYHFSGTCLFNKGLGHQCANSSECYIGENFLNTLTCSGGVCHCRDGYYQNAERLCIISGGSPIQKTSVGLIIFITTIIFYNAVGTM